MDKDGSDSGSSSYYINVDKSYNGFRDFIKNSKLSFKFFYYFKSIFNVTDFG